MQKRRRRNRIVVSTELLAQGLHNKPKQDRVRLTNKVIFAQVELLQFAELSNLRRNRALEVPNDHTRSRLSENDFG